MAGLSLEGKPWYVGLLIGLVLAAAIIWGANYAFINDLTNQITAADKQLNDLDTKIEQGRSAQRKLPQFQEEVKRLNDELKKLRNILPSTRNTEEIIKKLKELVDTGSFTLRKMTFPKLSAPQGSDPYAEWPISISVDGRYHNLVKLFEHLSNFKRIMNVEQISIAALPVQTERTITADFIAKTFMYIEPKEPEPAAKDVKK
ncbi:MAG TPA: type 4a pilus biogenesis protein PilO [Thermoanaerobaculia bacterium]|jgi:type IV pilus assembly protein PilO|nr:type 4a pilus biogenesis protein PilO [Thermoanaerobaculia bacterium]